MVAPKSVAVIVTFVAALATYYSGRTLPDPIQKLSGDSCRVCPSDTIQRERDERAAIEAAAAAEVSASMRGSEKLGGEESEGSVDSMSGTVAPPPPPPPPTVTVCTGAHKYTFSLLENLIGSLQRHEPELRVKVWDVGMTRQQAAAVKQWCGVDVVRFPFRKYPAHVDIHLLDDYAWRPLVINECVNKWENVLYLHTDQEVHNSLTEAKEFLLTNTTSGGFLVTEPGPLNPAIDDGALEQLHIERSRIESASIVGASVVGFRKNTLASEQVLRKWVKCAKNMDCVTPFWADLSTHRKDVAALSAIVAVTEGVEARNDNLYGGRPVRAGISDRDSAITLTRGKVGVLPMSSYVCWNVTTGGGVSDADKNL